MCLCCVANDNVVLESVQYRGQHVGVQPNGTVKEPGRTGTGQHAQFRLIVHTQPHVSLVVVMTILPSCVGCDDHHMRHDSRKAPFAIEHTSCTLLLSRMQALLTLMYTSLLHMCIDPCVC